MPSPWWDQSYGSTHAEKSKKRDRTNRSHQQSANGVTQESEPGYGYAPRLSSR